MRLLWKNTLWGVVNDEFKGIKRSVTIAPKDREQMYQVRS